MLVRAELDAVEAAYGRLRAAATDLVGNAFRVEESPAEVLEDQQRVNQGCPTGSPPRSPNRSTAPTILEFTCPPVSKSRDVLASRQRLTAEVRVPVSGGRPDPCPPVVGPGRRGSLNSRTGRRGPEGPATG